MGKRLVYAAQSNRDSSPLSIGELACAGAFSAVPATLVAGPAERVKVLLQVCPFLLCCVRGNGLTIGIGSSWKCCIHRTSGCC
jgi:hypothetical protein